MNSLIKRGAKITIGEVGAEITQWQHEARLIHICTNEGHSKVMTEAEFFRLHRAGGLTLDDILPGGVEAEDQRILYGLTAEQRSILDRRLGYVNAIRNEKGSYIKSEEVRDTLIEKHQLETNDKFKPKSSTVVRWFQRYKISGNDLRALLPKNWKKGNRKPRYSEKIEAIVERAIALHYLKGHQKCKKIYKTYLPLMLKEEGISRDDWPKYSFLRARAARVHEYDKHATWYGGISAENSFANGRPTVKAKFQLSRAEIDHTPLDIDVFDEDGKEIGRPNVTFIIDCYSRMILGYYMSLTPVSKRNVLEAVVHSIYPKTEYRELYPDIKNDWPCFGMYSQLVSDNGLDLIADQVKESLDMIGIDYTQNPKGTPKHKGTVERFMRTINEDLLHTLPTTTHANYIKKGKRRLPENAGKPTLEDIDYLINKWIVDIYHISEHEGLANESPINVWKSSAKTYEAPVLPSNSTLIELMFLGEDTRTLQKDGLSYESLKYNSQQLQKIARRSGYGVELKIRYDPDDIAQIKVEDPDTNELFSVPCIQARYAGMKKTFAEHKQSLALAKEKRKEASLVTEKELIDSYASIVAKIEEMRIRDQNSKRRRSQKHKNDETRKKTSATIKAAVTGKAKRAQTKLVDDDVLKEESLDFSVIP